MGCNFFFVFIEYSVGINPIAWSEHIVLGFAEGFRGHTVQNVPLGSMIYFQLMELENCFDEYVMYSFFHSITYSR